MLFTSPPAARRIGLAVLAPFLALLAACGDGASQSAGEPEPRPVRLERVEAAPTLDSRVFVGRIEAVRTVDIAFRQAGLLLEQPWLEGQLVPQGSPLAALDEEPLRLAVREAEARHAFAEREWRRRRALPSGVVARASVEEAETEYLLRRVELDRARQNLDFARVTAPFDALITRRLAEPHSVIASGTPVLRVQDVTELRVAISVPGELLARFGNDPAMVRAEAQLPTIGEQPFPLEFRELRTEPNAVAQTYQVSFGMPRPEGGLILPGMSANVRLRPAEGQGAALRIPVAAVASDAAGQPHVWVLDEGASTLRRQAVTLGEAADGQIRVLEGLENGTRIVTAGVGHLREGMPVRALELR